MIMYRSRLVFGVSLVPASNSLSTRYGTRSELCTLVATVVVRDYRYLSETVSLRVSRARMNNAVSESD